MELDKRIDDEITNHLIGTTKEIILEIIRIESVFIKDKEDNVDTDIDKESEIMLEKMTKIIGDLFEYSFIKGVEYERKNNSFPYLNSN